MTKTTHRYDESFTIPADADHQEVIRIITHALMSLEDTGADIDWANLEISSERDAQFEHTFTGAFERLVSEYTTVTLTARGRK